MAGGLEGCSGMARADGPVAAADEDAVMPDNASVDAALGWRAKTIFEPTSKSKRCAAAPFVISLWCMAATVGLQQGRANTIFLQLLRSQPSSSGSVPHPRARAAPGLVYATSNLFGHQCRRYLPLRCLTLWAHFAAITKSCCRSCHATLARDPRSSTARCRLDSQCVMAAGRCCS